MGAQLGYVAVVYDDYNVCVLYGGESVCYYNTGTAFLGTVQRFLDNLEEWDERIILALMMWTQLQNQP